MYARTATAVAASLSLAAAPALADVLVDFEQASDLNDFTPTTGYAQSATAGVGGAGGLTVAGNAAVAHYTPETFDLLSDGDSWTLSMDGFYDAQDASGNLGPAIRVGFTPDSTTGFAGGDNVIHGTLQTSATSSQLQIQIGASNIDSVGGSALADDTWYRLVVDITATPSNGIDVAAELFSLGATGLGVPTSVATHSFSGVSAAIRGDAALNAAFKTNAASGVAQLDNFTVVPEPASLTLAALGAMLVARRRR